jgi:ABC-type dipeptide/oligopeptide/nickel transport system ATPase component
MKPSYCLEIKKMSIAVETPSGVRQLVNNISFAIEPGKIMGLVGESGSGKSLTAIGILGLLRHKNFRCRGEVYFNGQELLTLPKSSMRAIRGKEIGMVFQDPMAALNPVLTVGRQLQEIFRTHEACSPKIATAKSIEMLYQVRLPQPEQAYRQFPHELSGGMRQRVMIAMALALKPALLIADEPTTALDVTLQAQILHELQQLQQNYSTTILLISHDMGVIAELADEVAVMRQGEIVEHNDCIALFDEPRHEYTRKLLAASRMDSQDNNREKQYGAITA